MQTSRLFITNVCFKILSLLRQKVLSMPECNSCTLFLQNLSCFCRVHSVVEFMLSS